MWNRISGIFRLRYPYTNPVEQRQAVSILYISLTFSLILVFWLGIFLLSSDTQIDAITLAAMIGSPGLVLLLYALVQTGRLRAAAWVFTTFLIVLTITPLGDGLDQGLVAAPIISMTAALLLLGRRGVLVAGIVALVGLLGGALVQSGETAPVTVIRADNVGFDLPAMLTVYALVGVVLYAFGGNIQRVIAQSLRQITFTRQIVDFSFAATAAKENDIYTSAVTLLRERMGYPFAQIYLADDHAYLTRRVRSGVVRGDETLLVAVQIGPASSLQNAASLRETVIVTPQDRENRREHLLPSMSHSIALPILMPASAPDAVPILLGVLDVQTQTDTIDAADRDTLEALAQQIGIAVSQRRRFEALTGDIVEQNEIIEALRRQLRSIRQTEIGLASGAWDTYLTGRRRAAIGFDFDPATRTLTAAGDQPDHLQAVMAARQPLVHDREDGSYRVEVPVMLNDEVLGAMAFDLPHPPDEGEVQMAMIVAGRLALALENKRLFEQSQALANRERKASEATGLLISANDVQVVMDLAADSFNRALGAVHTRIEINPLVVTGDTPRGPAPHGAHLGAVHGGPSRPGAGPAVEGDEAW